jgi:hypothetical protein
MSRRVPDRALSREHTLTRAIATTSAASGSGPPETEEGVGSEADQDRECPPPRFSVER